MRPTWTLQSDSVDSSVLESSVPMSRESSLPAIAVDQLTSALSASSLSSESTESTLSSSQNAATVDRRRNIAVMIPVRTSQPLAASHQSASTEHSEQGPVVTAAKQTHSALLLVCS